MTKARPASPEAWLEEVGAEYLAKIDALEPQFLVELEISDSELGEIFRRLSVARPTRWTSTQLACLAVGAVHAAARAEQGEDSFREVFYERLGRDFDHGEWESHYGPKAVSFLRERFSVELLTTGPYRYVGSIYRHAGIPVPARGRFAGLLASLLKLGPVFTRGQYNSAVERCSSSVLRRFLESSAGYELSQATARFVVRLERGLVAKEELVAFPSYRRSLYEAVLRELEPSRNERKTSGAPTFPSPILALDPETRRLVVKFDPKGVAAGAYRKVGGGPVYYAIEPVTQSSQLEFLIRSEPEVVRVTPWWVPGRTSGAVFRQTDGGLVDCSRDIPAGVYYLVTSIPECVEEDAILEYDAYLDNTSNSDAPYYSILLVDLRPGVCIPALSIRVRRGASVPVIEFSDRDGSGRSEFGRYTFVDELPPLSVSNWDADSNKKYWIWMDDGSGEKRIQPSSNRVDVRVACPSQGRIWIEAKYPSVETSSLQEIGYAVIPAEVRIRTAQKTYALDESAELEVKLPNGWRFVPIERLYRLETAKWEIPRRVRVVDANLEYQDLRIPISLIIPRVGLWFKAPREGSIVWREELDGSLPIILDGLAGSRAQIGLKSEDGRLLQVCDLGLLPAGGTRKITLNHFRDALALCGAVFGRFVVIAGDENVQTDRFFANAERIKSSLAGEALDSDLFRLPGIGEDLLRARLILEAVPSGHLFRAELDVPDSLRSFLCGLACLAADLDDAPLPDERSAYLRFASSEVQTVLRWINAAKASLQSLGNEQKVLLEFPEYDVETIPARRWRDSITDLVGQLRLNLDCPALINKWREAVRNSDHESGSELVGRAYGHQLTECARKYSSSFRTRGKTRNEFLTSAIVDLTKIIEAKGADPLVKLLSSAILQLALFHSDRLEDAARISVLHAPASCARLTGLMEALAARCKGRSAVGWPVGEIGFFEVSGEEADRKLESELSEHIGNFQADVPSREAQ